MYKNIISVTNDRSYCSYVLPNSRTGLSSRDPSMFPLAWNDRRSLPVEYLASVFI